MGWKNLIIGEKMPEKDDPAYKEKREQAENAGKTFAETIRLNKVAAKVQGFATHHNKLFLGLVFAFVLFSVGLNLYRMCTAVQHERHPESAVQRQEKELHFERHHSPTVKQMGEKSQDDTLISQRSNNPKTIEEYEAYRKN